MNAPTGRSYHVRTGSEGVARRHARVMARAEGHPHPGGTILHTELLEPGLWEVVIEEAPHPIYGQRSSWYDRLLAQQIAEGQFDPEVNDYDPGTTE